MQNNELLVHAIGCAKTEGVLNGCIINPKSVQNSILSAIKEASQKTTVTAKNSISNLPLYNSSFHKNKAKIPIISPQKKVSPSDLTLLSSILNKSHKNTKQKIIHSHIHHYAVDYKITNTPLEKQGSYIEAHNINISMDIRNIRALKQLLITAGLPPKAIVHDSYCLAHALLSETERREGGMILDLGTHYSKIHIMVNSKIINTQFIPIGQNHVIKDIATCLHTSLSEAQRLLNKYGTTFLPHCDSKGNILIYGIKKQHKVKHRLLCQIIESRITEILKLLFKKCGDSIHSCPKIIITGSGQAIPGLKELMLQRWSKTCQFDTHTTKEKNGAVQYSTSLGGILASLHHQRIQYEKHQKTTKISKPFFNFLK